MKNADKPINPFVNDDGFGTTEGNINTETDLIGLTRNKEILELARAGVDIPMHLPTFEAMYSWVKYLKPYGYIITDVRDYRYNNPNCTFLKINKI